MSDCEASGRVREVNAPAVVRNCYGGSTYRRRALARNPTRAGVGVGDCELGGAPGVDVRLLHSSGVLGCGGAAWPRRGSGSAPAEHGGVALGRKGGGSVGDGVPRGAVWRFKGQARDLGVRAREKGSPAISAVMPRGRFAR